jgi:hypothetical protein
VLDDNVSLNVSLVGMGKGGTSLEVLWCPEHCSVTGLNMFLNPCGRAFRTILLLPVRTHQKHLSTIHFCTELSDSPHLTFKTLLAAMADHNSSPAQANVQVSPNAQANIRNPYNDIHEVFEGPN